MKRTFRVTPKSAIAASTNNSNWWKRYYDRYTDAEIMRRYNLDQDELDAGRADVVDPSTGAEHISWLVAKPKYVEILEDDGQDVAELVKIDGKLRPVILIDDRIYDIDEPER